MSNTENTKEVVDNSGEEEEELSVEDLESVVGGANPQAGAVAKVPGKVMLPGGKKGIIINN